MSVVGEILYCFVIACIKLSILLLYWHIFPLSTFRYLVSAMMAVVMGWALSGAFASGFQCTPFAYAYDPESYPDGHCINLGLQNLVSGIINVVTDFAIIGMVIPLVWKLQISRRKKWFVTIAFAAGSRYV